MVIWQMALIAALTWQLPVAASQHSSSCGSFTAPCVCPAATYAVEQPPPPGATHGCVQRPGEVVVVPTAWWHATCNYGGTFAFGGEDDCDVRPCPSRPVGERDVCADAELVVQCHGPLGAESRSAYATRMRIEGSKTAKGELEQSIMTVRRVDSSVWEALDWRDKDEL